MKKRLVTTLGGCLIFSSLIILVLAGLSRTVTKSKGSFLRAFRQHAIAELLDLDIKVNSYYLAGVGHNTVFLGNHLAPLHVLSINCLSGDSAHYAMQVKGIHREKFWSIRLEVDSPDFYMYDGAVPRIYKGKVMHWKAERFNHDTAFFQDFEPIGPNSFAIKSLFGKERNASLGKLSISEPHLTFEPEILQKQVDGFFCTDGYLQYDKTSNRLVYLYRYRNEYLVLDTSLLLISKGKTIDTNSIAKIEVATIQSTQSRVFQTPPLVVNDKSSVYGNYLFVNSALLSNNEAEDALDAASVIDVYDLAKQQYLFSFYIFDHHTGEKLREFRVSGTKLIALFPTRLQVFDISSQYFPGLAPGKREDIYTRVDQDKTDAWKK